ncbi:hypothetical protein HDU76_006387 [Blyttiomyces sp. JEL0837]|nr:hypothetical protein HDU76_006387 [Blyttiomyces sp. JEL0837]
MSKIVVTCEGCVDQKSVISCFQTNAFLVIYNDPIGCDEYQIWPQIAEEIQSRLPLRNVIWQNGRAQQGPRLIDVVDLEIRPFKVDMFPRAIPGAANPFFVHLYLVNCEEGLACTYELMNIVDDALVQYDELEAAFFQNLLEQGAPWFQSFGGTDSGDDRNDVLNVALKPYRDMILQNTIRIFDFRIYLFARQVQLLFKLPDGPNEVSLIPYFAEAWTFSTCMNVILHCDELVAVSSHLHSSTGVYEAVRGELLYLARIQLDIIGRASGLYPKSVHSKNTTEHNDPAMSKTEGSNGAITNGELRTALGSESEYDDLYIRLSKRAIQSLKTGNRWRSCILLRRDIANLHFYRQRFSDAMALYEEDLDAPNTAGLSLGTDMDTSITTIEAMVTNVEFNASEEMKEAVAELSAFSPKMTQELVKPESCLFRVSLKSIDYVIGMESTMQLHLEIFSFLKSSINLDELLVALSGPSGDVLCRKTPIDITAGSNAISITCETNMKEGALTAGSVTIKLGRVSFTYSCPVSELRRLKIQKDYGGQLPLIQLKQNSTDKGVWGDALYQNSDLVWWNKAINMVPSTTVRYTVSPVLGEPNQSWVFENIWDGTASLQLPDCPPDHVIKFELPCRFDRVPSVAEKTLASIDVTGRSDNSLVLENVTLESPSGGANGGITLKPLFQSSDMILLNGQKKSFIFQVDHEANLDKLVFSVDSYSLKEGKELIKHCSNVYNINVIIAADIDNFARQTLLNLLLDKCGSNLARVMMNIADENVFSKVDVTPYALFGAYHMEKVLAEPILENLSFADSEMKSFFASALSSLYKNKPLIRGRTQSPASDDHISRVEYAFDVNKSQVCIERSD